MARVCRAELRKRIARFDIGFDGRVLRGSARMVGLRSTRWAGDGQGDHCRAERGRNDLSHHLLPVFDG
jgi:hypothetical protein